MKETPAQGGFCVFCKVRWANMDGVSEQRGRPEERDGGAAVSDELIGAAAQRVHC